MSTSVPIFTNTKLFQNHSMGEWGNVGAFAVIKADGSVVTWGYGSYGGDSSAVAEQLDGTIDVTQIYSRRDGFAALRSDSSVVSWGGRFNLATPLDGTIDVTHIFSIGEDISSSFAALRSDGSVVTWGFGGNGGNSSSVAAQINGTIDVIQIYSTERAFAALREDGSVVTWGDWWYGGDSGEVAAQLDGTIDVTQIYSTLGAFAALRSDGSVVTWGVSFLGDVGIALDGTIDAVQLCSTTGAFAALLSDGSVVAWGNQGYYGGDSSAVAAQLDGTIEVTHIYSTGWAFAALRSDGSVVTWSDTGPNGSTVTIGGDSSAVATQLDGTIDVTQIYSTERAFAALRKDGSVVTWGMPSAGGDSTAVATQLDGTIDVTQIYSTCSGFAALRSDGSVVTWGGDGGDSSTVAEQLNGSIDVTQIFSTDYAFAALRSDGSIVTWGNSQYGGNSGSVAGQLASGVVSGADIYTNDFIKNGTPDSDVLNGDTGNDSLNGSIGEDTMTGGLGNDTYYVDNEGDKTIEAAGAGSGVDTVISSITWSLAANVEKLTLIGAAAINGTGNNLANTLTGNNSNNVLNGLAGMDTMIGGLGNDTYIVNATGDVVTEEANQGTDTVKSAINYTLSANMEKLILTGAAAINGTGNTLNNTLTGNSGNNILDGDAGLDTMVGGLGNDAYYVDNVGDIATEASSLVSEVDTVNSSVTYTLGANLENLTLTGTAAINATGNELINNLTGNNEANILDGGLGADTMIGGLGDDTYYVDVAGDVVTELANAGIDTVFSSVSRTLGNNLENLILTGATAINGTGNTLANTLIGNDANNVLNGGVGNDSLNGGAGKDTFLFNSSLDGNIDSIEDFVAIADTIRLDQTIFSSLTALGSLGGTGCFRSSNTGTAVDDNDYILYNRSTGALLYDADGSGTEAAPVQFATLETKPAITAADFVVVA